MSDDQSRFDYVTLLPEVLQESDAQPVTGAQGGASIARLLDVIAPMLEDFEALLDNVSDFFDPHRTCQQFLPWLASWVALVLRADWDLEQRRRILAQIIPLYRKRGTKAGLQEYLKIYVGPGVYILDDQPSLQVGVTSTVGMNTLVGGLPPHFFRVKLVFKSLDELTRKAESVKAVLDIEKPAHTYYSLSWEGPKLQINATSTVGVDTYV